MAHNLAHDVDVRTISISHAVLQRSLTDNAVCDASVAARVGVASHDRVNDGHVGVLWHREMIEAVLEHWRVVILVEYVQHHCRCIVERRERTVLDVGWHKEYDATSARSP